MFTPASERLPLFETTERTIAGANRSWSWLASGENDRGPSFRRNPDAERLEEDYAVESNAVYVDYFTALVGERGWLKDAPATVVEGPPPPRGGPGRGVAPTPGRAPSGRK